MSRRAARSRFVAGVEPEVERALAAAGGKRLFDGFTRSMDLEHIGVRRSRFATFIDYRIRRT